MSRTRLASLAVLAVAALPVLSACTTSPGSAAIIGSTRITTGQLQAQVDAGVAAGKIPASGRLSFTRELLGHAIAVDLTNDVAKAHHVTLTKQDVSAELATAVQQTGSLSALQQQAAQNGISAAALPGFIRYAAMQQKLGTALTAGLTATPAQLKAEYQKDIDTYDQVNIAQIAVKTKALAQSILAQVQATPSSFAALAKKYSLDTTTKDNGGNVGFVGRSEVQKVLGPADQAAKPGSYVIAHTTGDYSVIHIIARKRQSLASVTPQLTMAIFAAQAQTLLTKAVTAEGAKIGVHVSPRYGSWDNATGAVVGVKSQISVP